MHKPVSYQRQKIQEKVRNGELTLGEEVVASEYSCYRVAHDTNTIVEEKDRECARKVSFL